MARLLGRWFGVLELVVAALGLEGTVVCDGSVPAAMVGAGRPPTAHTRLGIEEA